MRTIRGLDHERYQELEKVFDDTFNFFSESKILKPLDPKEHLMPLCLTQWLCRQLD